MFAIICLVFQATIFVFAVVMTPMDTFRATQYIAPP